MQDCKGGGGGWEEMYALELQTQPYRLQCLQIMPYFLKTSSLIDVFKDSLHSRATSALGKERRK